MGDWLKLTILISKIERVFAITILVISAILLTKFVLFAWSVSFWFFLFIVLVYLIIAFYFLNILKNVL